MSRVLFRYDLVLIVNFPAIKTKKEKKVNKLELICYVIFGEDVLVRLSVPSDGLRER